VEWNMIFLEDSSTGEVYRPSELLEKDVFDPQTGELRPEYGTEEFREELKRKIDEEYDWRGEPLDVNTLQKCKYLASRDGELFSEVENDSQRKKLRRQFNWNVRQECRSLAYDRDRQRRRERACALREARRLNQARRKSTERIARLRFRGNAHTRRRASRATFTHVSATDSGDSGSSGDDGGSGSSDSDPPGPGARAYLLHPLTSHPKRNKEMSNNNINKL
jgi:hypothetical protein